MSKKFVRNITNTRIKGAIQEPLNTNIQNDLLSDDEDVAVRNKDEYHLLTDNVKSITSGNDGIKVKVTGKNSRELVAKIVELTTETDEVNITNPETNVFKIAIDFSEYTDKTLFESEIQRLENEIENGIGNDENGTCRDINIIKNVSSINMYDKNRCLTHYIFSDSSTTITIDFGTENDQRTNFLNIIFIENQSSEVKQLNPQNYENVLFYMDIPESINPYGILMIQYVYNYQEENQYPTGQIITGLKDLTKESDDPDEN